MFIHTYFLDGLKINQPKVNASMLCIFREIYYVAIFLIPVGIYFYINLPTIHEGIFANGDWAVLSTMTRRAQAFEQLLGNYSRFGWSHLGPAVFYMIGFMCLFLERFTTPEIVAVFCYETIFLYLSYRMLIMYLGYPISLLLISILWFVILCIRMIYPAELIHHMFFIYCVPVMTVLPMLLFIISFSMVAAGYRNSILAMTISAAILPQLHIGTSFHALFFLVLSLILYIYRYKSIRGITIKDVFKEHHFLFFCFMGILTIVWCLPFYEAITNEGGNLKDVFDFFIQNALSEKESVSLHQVVSFLLTFYELPLKGIFILLNIGQKYFHVLYILATVASFILIGYGCIYIGARYRNVIVMVGLFFAMSVLSALNIKGEMYQFVMYWQYANVAMIFTLIIFSLCYLIGQIFKQYIFPKLSMSAELTFSFAVFLCICALLLQTPKLTFASKSEDIAFYQELKTWISYEDKEIVLQAGDHDTWPIVAGIYNAAKKDDLKVCVPGEWLFLFGKGSKCIQNSDIEIEFYLHNERDDINVDIIKKNGQLYKFENPKYGSRYVFRYRFRSPIINNKTLLDNLTKVSLINTLDFKQKNEND